jgi:hypothetical protein
MMTVRGLANWMVSASSGPKERMPLMDMESMEHMAQQVEEEEV